MSPSSPVEPSTSSTLHPRLQAALGSLEVELEDELTRYRRLQGRRPIPPEMPERRDRPAPAVVAAPPIAPNRTLEGRGHLRAVPSAQTPQEAIAPEPSIPVPLPLPLDTPPAPSGFDDPIPDDYLASSEELLRSLGEDEAELRAEQEPGLMQTLLTPLGIGSMLLLLLSSVTFGYLFTNPNNITLLGLEKLLRTPEPETGAIATAPSGEAETVAPSAISPNLSQSEFPDLNLGTLSTLPAATPLPTPLSTPLPTTAPTPGVVAEPQPTVAASSNPPAQRTTRATAAPSSAPVSTGARSAAPAPQRAAAPATRPNPAPARPAAPPRPVASPAPAPSPVAAAPSAPTSSAPVAAAASAPPREDLYYVVTDYTGDRSLDQARQAVDDAYVRNLPNRAVVQMGAFSEADRAQELQRELEQQGIPAQVYQP